MGINGLLPLLKSIHKSVNLKKFEGKTLGVDAYGWLHRGTVACAMELAMGKPTRKFVEFAMHRVRMLQHFGVIPFLIFDGDYLPSKAATEADRAKRREESKRIGLELLNAGKTSQAYLELQKAVDVTPEMARQLIDELKKTGVQYIVAPYEADAQMVYLERKGFIDGILSEDSDLLVFGAKCLLTKLDQYGNCIEVNKADFCSCREISLTGWSDVEFRRMAILSGCDYLASISNMGLKTAYRMVRKHKTIEKVIRMLQFDGKFYVPKGYLEAFNQAELTFLHQRVFCPKAQGLVLHTEPEKQIDEEKMPFIGAYVEPEIAQGVARGDLNPMTKLPIVIDGRKMVSSASPWTSSRPRRSASSPDLKKGKRIDTYMSKRIPLGELDPNSFTLSSSQQEALSRNPGPWMASSAPRNYLNRSNGESDLPQSAPPTRNQVGRTHTRGPTISETRPPKRARLCADIETDAPPGTNPKAELSRSRFFTSAAPEPSPTVGRNLRSKRSKKQDITIFSDDSMDEYMRNLPDYDGFANQGPKGKIPVFKEEDAGNVSTTRDPQSWEPVAPQSQTTSQSATPSLSFSTSVISSAEQPHTPIDEQQFTSVKVDESSAPEEDFYSLQDREALKRSGSAPLLSTVDILREKFSFSSGTSTPKSTAITHGLPTPVSSSPRPSRIPLAVKSNPSILNGKPFSTKGKLTPLQRIGAGATNKMPLTPPLTPGFPMRSFPPRRSLLAKGSVPFPDVVVEKKEVEPASVPLPAADETENIALLQNGSEDLIIHDSEEESDGLSPSPDDISAPKINMAQYVYTR